LRAIKAGYPDCGLLEAIQEDEENNGMLTIIAGRKETRKLKNKER
jgi:hypothetical protein